MIKINLDDYVKADDYVKTNDRVCNSIKKRMYPRINKIHFIVAEILRCMGDSTGQYYIAGNSCNVGTPNDYDIYPVVEGQFNFEHAKWPEKFEVICTTKNAMTVKTEVGVLQFCKYYKHSLKELVESFDFAHIKLGICVDYEPCDFNDMYIKNTYVSSDWLEATINSSSFYAEPAIKTAYPLSSLLRINKYIKRGNFQYGSYKAEVLKILIAFISRGFYSYKDFKDQLAAVDLLLLEQSESNAAWQLWLICCSAGLVKDTTNAPTNVFEFTADLQEDMEDGE